MLAVSSAVARGGRLSSMLDAVASQAAGVVAARSASILLLRGRERFQLAGSYGLSARYSAMLDGAPPLAPGHGPAGLAVERRTPVLIVDTETDQRFGPWRSVAAREGYRALVSIPLVAAGSTFGALTAYRDHAGPWSKRQIELLGFFAEHATHAIRTAELIDRQHREMAALSRLVRGLREQTHEHANRVHALGGLLALGDVDEARRFLTVIGSTYEETYGQIAGRVHSHALAGLIIAETLIARQRSVALELDDTTLVTRLPERLSDVEAVTVVGNLLGNAVDAVGGMPAPRRRVVLRMVEDADELTIAVRDWGPGIPEDERRRILEHGYTTKADHAGVGLPLVADVVAAARGRVTIEQPAHGTLFSVRVPFSGEADA